MSSPQSPLHRVCGLHPVYKGVNRDDYPLLNADVHYDLSDVQMLANLTQTYTSCATTDAEIRYVFPLPANASVCAFKAVIDNQRTLRGMVKEKITAKREYEQAVSQGKTAVLLEQSNVEIFQVSLGSIKPRQTIEIHISFVCVISQDGDADSLRLTFPIAIAPRYGSPPHGMSLVPTPDHSKHAFNFCVAVEMTSHIKSITSPSHPISMKLGGMTLESIEEFDPRKAYVSLSSPTLLDKDIVLVLGCQGLDKPRCMVESFSPVENSKEYTDAYALTLVPRFELPSLPTQEYIFLVDRSGSMDGRKMDAVRSALQILLMSLPSRGSHFNIISFGSSTTSLWPSSVVYSADSVKTASAHVDSMTANYGGTEIEVAIQAAFASRVTLLTDETKCTAVFVLTDGQSWDLDGVQSTIQTAVTKSKTRGLFLRTFCLGIGDAVSKAMCDAIARAGHGTAMFVGEEEKPDHKLMGLLRAARGVIVEDISIDWGVENNDTTGVDMHDFEMVSTLEETLDPPKDVTPISLFDESKTLSFGTADLGPQNRPVELPQPPRIQQAPPTKSLPPLYPGFRTNLFAIVQRGGGNTVPSKAVRIKGSALGRPVVLEVPVSQISKPATEQSAQVKVLHALAARALIQSIEDKSVINMSEVDKAEVLRLAKRYGLASSQTSFVAVDEQDQVVAPIEASERSPSGQLYELDEHALMARSKSRARAPKLARFSASAHYPPPPPPGGMPIFNSMAPSPQPSFEFLASPAPPAGFAARSFVSAAFGSAARFFSADHGPSRDSSVSILPVDKLESEDTHFEQSLLGLAGEGGLFGEPSNAPPASAQKHLPTIETFARVQSFDGSFTASPTLFKELFQGAQAPVRPAILDAAGALKDTLWCTLLCVAYLEVHFADDKDIWDVLAEKAMQFVEDTLIVNMGADMTERLRELKQDALMCISQGKK